MNNPYTFIFLFFTLQLSLQQNPGPFFADFTLDKLGDGDTFLIASGAQGLVVTPQGEFGEGWEDLILELERVALPNNAEGEWIYEWETLEGQVFEIIDDNGQLIQVGDDSSEENLSEYIASETGIPAVALPGVMEGLFGAIMNDVYVKDTNIQSISATEAYTLGSGGANNAVEEAT